MGLSGGVTRLKECEAAGRVEEVAGARPQAEPGLTNTLIEGRILRTVLMRIIDRVERGRMCGPQAEPRRWWKYGEWRARPLAELRCE